MPIVSLIDVVARALDEGDERGGGGAVTDADVDRHGVQPGVAEPYAVGVPRVGLGADPEDDVVVVIAGQCRHGVAQQVVRNATVLLDRGAHRFTGRRHLVRRDDDLRVGRQLTVDGEHDDEVAVRRDGHRLGHQTHLEPRGILGGGGRRRR